MKGFRYATSGSTLRLYKSDHRTDKKIVFLRRSTISDLRGRSGSKIPRVESAITSTRGHRWDVGSLQEPRCHNFWNVRLLSAFHFSLPTALSSLGTPNRTVAANTECAQSILNETRAIMACSRGWRDLTPERAVDEDQRHVHGIGNLAHRLERARSRVPSSWFRGKQIARKQLTLTAPILIVKSGSYPHPEAILMERRDLADPPHPAKGLTICSSSSFWSIVPSRLVGSRSPRRRLKSF